MTLAVPLVALVAGLAAALGQADPPPVARPVFTVQDPRIVEASSLVDLGPRGPRGLMVTANDSGDTGIVYVLDASGRTVGTTRFGDSVDAESMAPAGRGRVWVGDTGDNTASRPFIVLHDVPVGRGDRTVRVPAYRLAYPDGPHDAETLLSDPHTGRLYVVTKELLLSEVYAAPAHLDPDRVNRLTKVAPVSLTPTDGAFLSDGTHVILRGYGSANLYTFPAFRLLGGFQLPAQRQGESISVGPGGRLRIGSEGLHQPVLQIGLPSRLAARIAGDRSDTPSRAGDSARWSGQTGAVQADQGSGSGAPWPALAVVAIALGGLGGLVALVRTRRRTRAGD